MKSAGSEAFWSGIPRKSKELRRGMMERYPHFQENRYYRERIGEEERRLIAMQCRSDVRFYWYYRLKLLVRGVKSLLRKC